jgi:hypothetical protein
VSIGVYGGAHAASVRRRWECLVDGSVDQVWQMRDAYEKTIKQRMKKLIIAVFSFMFLNCANFQKIGNDILVFQIDFQDHFKNDIVDLSINGYEILSNNIITSEESIGKTDLTIVLTQHSKSEIAVLSQNKKMNIKYQDILYLKVKVNGVSNEFKLNQKNGKYIGLSKKDGNTLNIIQSVKKFAYD